MLRTYIVVVEASRFFLRQCQNVTCPFGEPVEAIHVRRSCMFPLDNFTEHLGELVKWIARACLVLCMGGDTLPLEVILQVGQCKAVIGTDAISGKLTFVNQATDGHWINVEQLRQFLRSLKRFHTILFSSVPGRLCITMRTIS